ncbi:hypothetical protein ADK57_35820 [Streptomyces sp. MMG1533]|nr:hypothetical protein ADK57_35820 [Streptomyces sp. MMG1533]
MEWRRRARRASRASRAGSWSADIASHGGTSSAVKAEPEGLFGVVRGSLGRCGGASQDRPPGTSLLLEGGGEEVDGDEVREVVGTDVRQFLRGAGGSQANSMAAGGVLTSVIPRPRSRKSSTAAMCSDNATGATAAMSSCFHTSGSSPSRCCSTTSPN